MQRTSEAETLPDACQPTEEETLAMTLAAPPVPIPRPAHLPHVQSNSGNDWWHTPLGILDRVRRVLGQIDCDPASNAVANLRVRATRYYTIDDSGLDMHKPWGARVFINPPYSRKLIKRFAHAFAARWESGEIREAIILVNNGSETQWFQIFARYASAQCLVKNRIIFDRPDGSPAGGKPLQGQACLYAGPNVAAFYREFSPLGTVWLPHP